MTQKDRVLHWLRKYGEITTLEAVELLGVLSLPRRIMELRREGYQIITTYKVTKAGTKYGVYTLTED